ncbi:MAG: hypothetical protein V7607_1665 [Solirubrobacteraceae bacterium]
MREVNIVSGRSHRGPGCASSSARTCAWDGDRSRRSTSPFNPARSNANSWPSQDTFAGSNPSAPAIAAMSSDAANEGERATQRNLRRTRDARRPSAIHTQPTATCSRPTTGQARACAWQTTSAPEEHGRRRTRISAPARPARNSPKLARKSARIAHEVPSNELALCATGTKSLQMPHDVPRQVTRPRVSGLRTYVSGDASLMSRDIGHTRPGLG